MPTWTAWFTPAKETWLYRLHPALKLLLIALLMIIVFFQRNIVFTVAQLLLFSTLLFSLSGYPLRKLLLLIAPFVLSAISTFITLLLFGKGTTIWWQWGLMKISAESFNAGLILGLKSIVVGTMSLTLMLTTRPVELFYALMQQFRFPPKYAYSFIASLRLIPFIVEEWQIRNHALQVRGVELRFGWKGIIHRLRMYFVPIMAQSIRRAQRVATAMEAKRFQIHAKRTYYYMTSYSSLDRWFAALLVCASLLCLWAAILL